MRYMGDAQCHTCYSGFDKNKETRNARMKMSPSISPIFTQMSVRPYVRPSTKSFFDFNEI